jgi:hypothetical protein
VQLDDLLNSEEKEPDKEITVIIDEKSAKQCNRAYMAWMARDEVVLGYLFLSLSHETLMHVSRCTSSAQAWHMLANLYASQPRARVINMRIALATTKKLHLSVRDYYSKMCQYADDLGVTGAPLRDDELVAYILAGLYQDYNPVFTDVVARTNRISPGELYSQLLSFEQHVSLQAHQTSGSSSSAMAATRGCGSSGGCGYCGSDRSHGRGRSRGHSSGTSSSWPQCHVCLKIGHTATNCWHRYEEDYVPEQRIVDAASSTGTDPAWYMDSGTTDHITSDLDCLTMHDPYTGHDQVHAFNELGMDITSIGTFIIPTTTHPLTLTNVLYVPSANKNLISVIEFHPFFFLIKDRKKKVMLHR